MSKKPGLYANIHAKRARGEKMRKPGEEGAPSAQDFKNAAKTAKKNKNKKREDPGGNMKAYFDTPKMKRGMKREDPKGNPAGYYDSNKKKKKADKSPYADGMGKKCTCDSIAEEFNAVLDTEAREDKPCGNSYIPERAKCAKGRGTAKKAEKSKVGNIGARMKQGASAGFKVGAVLGTVGGAYLGAKSGGLQGALKGAAIGGLGVGAYGSYVGASQGASYAVGEKLNKRFTRTRRNTKSMLSEQGKIKAEYKKAYAKGKASGLSRKKMQELDQKYAMKIARNADKRR